MVICMSEIECDKCEMQESGRNYMAGKYHRTTLQLCAVVLAGEQLTTAWESLLELLSVVPQAEEADTVQLAFQSVQLLCSDYMSSLPVHHLRRCVEVAALYGSQQVCA